MSQVEQIQGIRVGDTVAYRWETLRNRGWYTRDFLYARGTVTGLTPLGGAVFLRVAWDRHGLPTALSPQEICRLAPPARETGV